MLAHVRVAWATDLRHLVHLLQPEYASFLRFPRFFPYMRRFTPIIELNRPLSKTKPVLRELTAQKNGGTASSSEEAIPPFSVNWVSGLSELELRGCRRA